MHSIFCHLKQGGAEEGCQLQEDQQGRKTRATRPGFVTASYNQLPIPGTSAHLVSSSSRDLKLIPEYHPPCLLVTVIYRPFSLRIVPLPRWLQDLGGTDKWFLRQQCPCLHQREVVISLRQVLGLKEPMQVITGRYDWTQTHAQAIVTATIFSTHLLMHSSSWAVIMKYHRPALQKFISRDSRG